ncbi:MAG: DUF2079 domain-containing protein [Elusimicrobia bacterium]|nr:DUF2079 domain-containing protein [Elusimicrobiota bacterium]
MTASAVSAIRACYDAGLSAVSFSVLAGAAAIAAVGPLRARLEAALARGDALEGKRAAALLRAAAVLLLLGALALKAVQYLSFQLLSDAAVIANTAASVLDGRGLACSIDGTPSVLTVHFAFFIPLFLSPLLLAWPSILVLALAQAAAVVSCIAAAYRIAARTSRWAGLLAATAVACHPLLHELLTANVENAVWGAPLALWGLERWTAGRRPWAVWLWVLALTTRESFPFTVAGLGVWWALTEGRENRSRVPIAAAVVLGAALLWLLEMKVVWSHAYGDSLNAGYWSRYAHFGANSTEVMATVFRRPWRLALWMLRPEGWVLLLREAALMGLAPLAAPAALLLYAASASHYLLQETYNLSVQNASYVFGPLAFAAASGLARLDAHPRLAGRRAWLAVPVLLAAGIGLRDASRVVHPSLGLDIVSAGPALVGRVPRGASVWADEFAGLWLSARPQVKLLRVGGLPVRFERLLFRPEYVLLRKVSAATMPPEERARTFSFFAREGYVAVADSGPLVLVKDPEAPHGRSGSPALSLPPGSGDPALAARWLGALFDSERTRTALAAYPPDLRVEPYAAEEHVNLGRALSGRGLYPLASSHFRAALALQPDLLEAHNNLGNALMAQGRMAEAEASLRAALARAPGNSKVRYNLGNVLLKTGKLAEAAAQFEAGLAAEPRNAQLLNSLGAAHLLSGRRDAARAAFEAALAVDPGLTDAAENLRVLGRRAKGS